MELCSMLHNNLDGRGVWGKMDTCVCLAKSPSPFAVPLKLSQRSLLIGYAAA